MDNKITGSSLTKLQNQTIIYIYKYMYVYIYIYAMICSDDTSYPNETNVSNPHSVSLASSP
jgi:hypothetical protein